MPHAMKCKYSVKYTFHTSYVEQTCSVSRKNSHGSALGMEWSSDENQGSNKMFLLRMLTLFPLLPPYGVWPTVSQTLLFRTDFVDTCEPIFTKF